MARHSHSTKYFYRDLSNLKGITTGRAGVPAKQLERHCWPEQADREISTHISGFVPVVNAIVR